MENIMLTQDFTNTAISPLLKKGGMWLYGTKTTPFMRSGWHAKGGHLESRIILLEVEKMHELAQDHEAFVKASSDDWDDASRKKFIDLVTTPPSLRRKVPKAHYDRNGISFVSGENVAAYLLEAGATHLPIEMDQGSAERLKRDGFPPYAVIQTADFPGYDNEATSNIYNFYQDNIVSPVKACNFSLRLDDLIATMTEALPLLYAEESCEKDYLRLMRDIDCKPPKGTLALRQKNSNEAQFHREIIELVLPFLLAMRAEGHDLLEENYLYSFPTVLGSRPQEKAMDWLMNIWLTEAKKDTPALNAPRSSLISEAWSPTPPTR